MIWVLAQAHDRGHVVECKEYPRLHICAKKCYIIAAPVRCGKRREVYMFRNIIIIAVFLLSISEVQAQLTSPAPTTCPQYQSQSNQLGEILDEELSRVQAERRLWETTEKTSPKRSQMMRDGIATRH